MVTDLRPERGPAPDTSRKAGREEIDADIAHESTLRYFVEHTELGVLDKDQMGIISLVDSYDKIGLKLPGTKQFFERLRCLSSGEEGKGRVQVKEVITAGAFPMSLLFGEQKGGVLEFIKGLIPGRKQETPQQKGM